MTKTNIGAPRASTALHFKKSPLSSLDVPTAESGVEPSGSTNGMEPAGNIAHVIGKNPNAVQALHNHLKTTGRLEYLRNNMVRILAEGLSHKA